MLSIKNSLHYVFFIIDHSLEYYYAKNVAKWEKEKIIKKILYVPIKSNHQIEKVTTTIVWTTKKWSKWKRLYVY